MSNFLNNNLDGALLAARYAFMPNKLRYCGGDNNSELFEYAAHQASDDGLKELLKEFETMFPYLKLIAEANKIIDPFNYKVVEAYWLGNELLENVSMNNFYRYLVDEQKLKKKLKPSLAQKVFGKIPVGAKPHHSFHVLNIPKRTGNYPVEHTLLTMDECRISWGQIKEFKQDNKDQKSFSRKIIVDYQPLQVVGDNIILGQKQAREVWSELNNQSFATELKVNNQTSAEALVGKWVAIHWGWVCDFLTEDQVKNLEKWTKYNLNLANQYV